MVVNVGLDIGVSSVGLSVVDAFTGDVLEATSYLFECADASKNEERRAFRQSRRLVRRRQNRIKDFIKLWEKSGMPRPSELNISVVPLRVKALSEKIELDELYVVLLNNLKHRGISYLEDSENEISGNSDYARGLLLNQQELETKFPCEIQLERLHKYGRYRGQFSIDEGDEKIILSNMFTISAYRKEIEQLLDTQRKYHSEISDEFVKDYIDIFKRKRAYFEGPGNKKSRTDYGRFTTKIDEKTGEYITEDNIFEKLVGKCSVYSEEMRAAGASYTAQEFNLLNDLNNLTVAGRKLEEDEKRKIVDTIKAEKKVNVEKIIGKITGEDVETIEGARIDSEDKHIYHSFEAYRKIRDKLADVEFDINSLSRETLDEIARILTLNTEKEEIIKELSKDTLGLNDKVNNCLFEIRRKNGSLFNKWQSFSLKLMNDIIPDMYEQPKEQMTLLAEMGLLKSDKELYKGLKYIPKDALSDKIYNPVVLRASRIAIKALNAVIKKYGNPNMVVVEMPRDRNDDEKKKRIRTEQNNNEKEIKLIKEKILKEYGIVVDDAYFRNHKKLALKLKLWNEQNGRCLYSGKPIEIDKLLKNEGDYEIDHIVPISVSFDDSRSNKVLVMRTENRDKGNRTPYMYLNTLDRPWGWSEYSNAVKEIKKNISSKKFQNLISMQDITKVDILKGFINRNLNDTRYASKVVLNTLQNFFRSNETETKVKVIRGSFTSQMRKNMRLDKNREESYAHHAVDALLIVYSQMGYDEFRKLQGEFIDFDTGEILDEKMWTKKMTDETYNEFLYQLKWSHVRDNIKRTEEKIKYWHMTDKKCNRSFCNQNAVGTRVFDNKTYMISNTGDIRSDKGYETFKKLIKNGKGEKLLVAKHDPKTYAILLDIYESYKDAKNPFVQYEKETGEIVRKYSKKNDGPKIVSLKYENGEVNSCIDVSHKYGFEKQSKHVILTSLSPYRMDVYYNTNDNKYYMIGLKYSDIKCQGNKFVVDEDAYARILLSEKMIVSGQNRDDLQRLGYVFKYSFYKNEYIEYEKDGETYVERFLSRTKPAQRNYIETKPIGKGEFEKRKVIGLSKTKSVKKVKTDMLGNRFYCNQEIFSLEC